MCAFVRVHVQGLVTVVSGILKGRVPGVCMKKSYPNLEPLGLEKSCFNASPSINPDRSVSVGKNGIGKRWLNGKKLCCDGPPTHRLRATVTCYISACNVNSCL